MTRTIDHVNAEKQKKEREYNNRSYTPSQQSIQLLTRPIMTISHGKSHGHAFDSLLLRTPP